MNWYKTSQIQLETLEDRNVLNDKIKYLEMIGEQLGELSRIVFQNAKTAKTMNFELANNKKVSNHPKLKDIMMYADQIALDSPWKFADTCLSAADFIDEEIIRLKREREKFSNETLPKRMKGWFEND